MPRHLSSNNSIPLLSRAPPRSHWRTLAMEVAVSVSDLPPVPPDLRCFASDSPSRRGKWVHKEEAYVDSLARASLHMVRKGLPVEVQCHGVRMILHLLWFRKVELSSSKLADLRKVLVGSLDDLVLKDATDFFDDPIDCTANFKENNKHWRCLLVVLAATETNSLGYATGGEGSPNPLCNISSNSDWSSDRSIWGETYCSSVVSCDKSIGEIAINNYACKEFVEVYPGMMANGDQGKEALLLMEHNIICQAFLLLVYKSGVHQYKEILPLLLSLLEEIWTLPDWTSRYLHHGSGLAFLFSDKQFLKMVYYLVRFCEVELERSRTKLFTAVKSCEHYIVTLLPLILRLNLKLFQCVHGLWCPFNPYSLSEVLEGAKHPSSEHNKLVCVQNEEDSQERRALIEGIRESGYKVIGLCTSIDGAFSWLLNGSVGVALSKSLDTLEFRHLGKLIKHTVIPLIKNCPWKFWKEWVDCFLQILLRHCGNILHHAWFSLLYDGRAGVPYYFGKLTGLEGTIKTLENDILLEFTREVTGLLEVIASVEQDRDIDSIPSTSLFRHLVANDCFGTLRMSLFGYFVDGIATAKAIPFCRALVCLAVDSNDARLRKFIVHNLLPCIIQHIDSEVPSAIQNLKLKLNSSARVNATGDELNLSANDNVHKDLVVLCQELYAGGFVQIQAFGCEKNSCNTFDVWLQRQKDNFRAKAFSAAAKKRPSGKLWNWELEVECEGHLSDYIDMLRMVDETDDFAENIYVDPESLFQKLGPDFRSNYAINISAHPYMKIISSIQHRKFYSMADVVRNTKIGNVVCKLIELKPYIKGSDRTCDIICRLQRTSEIPPELSKYVVPSVELLHFVLLFWEPRFHPMIRQAITGQLLNVVDELTARGRCLEPLVPLIGDFPLHLQSYAHALIDTKLKESKYYFARGQISLHEDFDDYLATGEFDDKLRLMCSKDVCVDRLVNMVPSKYSELELDLRKLSLERRAKIVHLHIESSRYLECLQGLFASEEGKTYFSEMVEKFDKLFLRSSLPKYYVIRGIIDCQAILLQKDINQEEALEKVVAVCSSLSGYLQKFWKDTMFYKHKYYDIIRNPLKQGREGRRGEEADKLASKVVEGGGRRQS